MEGLRYNSRALWRIGGILGLCASLIGCGSDSSAFSASLIFEPNPATVRSGVCVTEARITGAQSVSSTLVEVIASFSRVDGERVEFRFNNEALLQISDELFVPANGATSLNLHFDLAAQNLSLPTEGTVVAIGVTSSGVVQFVGHLRCEDE